VLGVLMFDGDDGALGPPEAKLDRAGWPQFAFALAAVNNGARALRDVRLTLTFARRNGAGRRVGAVDRGLFWDGVLAPGHAAKWNVRAPGSELRVDADVTGTLAKAHLDPAPADAFFSLTSSRFRAVRLHGAAMLAYLRDPRAAVVARALSAESAGDAVMVARIRRAAAPVIACALRREGEQLSACIFNGASQVKKGLLLREVTASQGAPEARSIELDGAIPIHDGIRMKLSIPADLSEDVAVVDPSAAD
jgi:hypothetical protein